MKFPIKVTYHNLEAKIYRSQISGVKYYKAAYRAKGGRVTKTFKKLKDAKEAATNGLKEIQPICSGFLGSRQQSSYWRNKEDGG